MATTVTNPVVLARSNVESMREGLENAKQDLIFAVQESGEDFYFDRDAHLYVGPDRHNSQWVVQWDEKQSRAAASQMMIDGQRSCNWQQCECKRPARGTFQARF